jgi:hypothetical protein
LKIKTTFRKLLILSLRWKDDMFWPVYVNAVGEVVVKGKPAVHLNAAK